MEGHFDSSYDDNNQDRFIKLEDMFSDNAYYYFDVSEWEIMIEHYLSSLKLDKAIRALDFAKHQHPTSLEISLKEAELLSERSEYRKALALLKKLEAKHPFDPDIPLLIGNTYSQIGRNLKAVEYYKKAYKHTDIQDASEIVFQLASEYLVMEKPQQSIYWLKKLLKSDPENIEALYEIALTFETYELVDEAIAFFEEFLESSPYNHHAWFNLGNLQTAKGKIEDALNSFDYSIISFDEFSSGWYNKGTIQARLGRHDQAIESFSKTLELEGPSAPTYCSLAESYEQLDDHESAFEYFKKTTDIDETYTEAWIGGANSALEKGDLKIALTFIEKAIKLDKDNSHAHYIYAEVCQSLHFFEEAKKAYKRVIQLDPENWEVFLDYSGILFEQGEEDNAIFIIESGMILTGNNTDLGFRAGAYHYLQGNTNQAFQLWSNALSGQPEGFDQIFEFDQELRCIPEIVEFIEQFENEL